MAEGRGIPAKQIIARGISAWERDDYASALADFQQVLKNHPNFPDVRNKAGLCLAMMGDLESALEAFNLALGVNSSYAEAHLNRAIVLNELGRFDEAREAFSRAGELDRRRGDEFPADLGNQIAIGHAKMGELYLQVDRPARAAEEFRNALDVRPSFLDIRSRLAEAYLDMGEIKRARSELEAILDENPLFTGARIRLGVALHRMGETERAVEEWRRCAEQTPEDRRVQGYLASYGKKSGAERASS